MENTHNLKKPCFDCPFRNDEKAIPLMKGRIEEIAGGLLEDNDSSFNCHNAQTKRCLGGMKFLMNNRSPNFPMRLAHIAGHIDLVELDEKELPVCSTIEELKQQQIIVNKKARKL